MLAAVTETLYRLCTKSVLWLYASNPAHQCGAALPIKVLLFIELVV